MDVCSVLRKRGRSAGWALIGEGDAGLDEFRADGGGIVFPLEGDVDEGHAVTREEFVHEPVAGDAVGTVVGGIVEFDGT